MDEEEEKKKFETEENDEKKKKNTLDKEALFERLKKCYQLLIFCWWHEIAISVTKNGHLDLSYLNSKSQSLQQKLVTLLPTWNFWRLEL